MATVKVSNVLEAIGILIIDEILLTTFFSGISTMPLVSVYVEVNSCELMSSFTSFYYILTEFSLAIIAAL